MQPMRRRPPQAYSQPPMELIGEALWQQVAGALAMLDNAVVACPDQLWPAPLWRVAPESEAPADASEFRVLAVHSLRWMERYLAAIPESEFASLPHTSAVTPDKPAVRSTLASLREHSQDTLTRLTNDELHRPITHYPWITAQLSYVELQIYNLRHLQEHAAQLCLFLGQHGVPDEALDWVSRADP